LGALEGKSVENIKDKLQTEYKNTMIANWKVFVPAACINLSVVPLSLRVLFLNVVFFFWTIFLSLVVNRKT
jgi:hypothetical protein